MYLGFVCLIFGFGGFVVVVVFGIWEGSFGLVGWVFLYVKVMTRKKKKDVLSLLWFLTLRNCTFHFEYLGFALIKSKTFVYIKEEKQHLLGI